MGIAVVGFRDFRGIFQTLSMRELPHTPYSGTRRNNPFLGQTEVLLSNRHIYSNSHFNKIVMKTLWLFY